MARSSRSEGTQREDRWRDDPSMPRTVDPRTGETVAPELPKLPPPPNPYEVRCYDCDTSFAPETKRCVHCGARIGRHGPMVMGAPQEEAEGEYRPSSARAALWVLTAIIMLLGSLMRMCQ